MKIEIKKGRDKNQGIPVERYLECLRRIFEKQSITHLKSGRFSTRTTSLVSYVLRQKYAKTYVEECDLLANDENITF